MKKKLMTAMILFYLFNPIQLMAAEWSEPVRLTEVGLDKNRAFDASEPAVAINSTTGSYIVVWEGNDDRPDMASAEVEIFANLFSQAGTLVNPDPIRVSFMGQANSLAYDGRQPEIVYNSNMNEYLVVWYGDHNTAGLVEGELEIFAQRINATTGELISGRKRISDMGQNSNRSFDALNPNVAYNSQNNTYLVVWHGEEGDAFSPLGSFEIYGQLLDSQANHIGENDFRISEMGPLNNSDYNAYSPSVAYNTVENEFMVVWYGEDDRDGRAPGEFEIYAQIINAQTGGLIGVESIAVSFVGLNGDVARSAQYPDVSYNQDANEYLLVWSADDSKDGRVGNEFEIYGQTLDAAGNEKLNNDFIISEMGVDGDNNFDAFRPKVVYQASTEQFVVLWRGDDNVDGEFEIFTQRLDGQTLIRLGLTSQQISRAGPDNNLLYDARRAAIAASPHSNKLILVWEQEDETENQTEGEFEIFGSSLLNTDFVIDGSISGSWYDLSRSGEGYIIQILPNERVLMVWFSYLPDTTEQAWFLGTGFIKHNRIVIDSAIITQGGLFGPNFDPAQVQNSPWGSVSFEFNTCRTGVINYQADSQAYGHGDHSLSRLTTINGLACGVAVVQDEDPLNAITGSWYDPSHSGEGWLLEYLGNNRVVMYWFTYDDQGQQKWMLSVGEVSGQMVMTFDNAIMTNGTSFGDGFDPDRVNQFPWGSIEMTVNDCNSITVAYESSIALYGQGQLDARRLTSLDGIDCIL